MPAGWTIGLSDNGWTTDALGLQWLVNVFDPATATRSLGRHRLLILDGHGSHATAEFDRACYERSIITLCIPPHSSHLLQPLDVGCFSPLKRAYSNALTESIRLGFNHIDKREFLSTYKQSRDIVLSASNIQSGFAAAGLVPFNPDRVLSTLSIRPYTPPEQGAQQATYHPETPHNVVELEKQFTLIKELLKRRSHSPPTPTDRALHQLVKGCQMAMQNAVLLAIENTNLKRVHEKQVRKRKLKRRYISKATVVSIDRAGQVQEMPAISSNVVEVPVSEGAPQAVTEEVATAAQQITCFICRGFDHYADSCQKYC